MPQYAAVLPCHCEEPFAPCHSEVGVALGDPLATLGDRRISRRSGQAPRRGNLLPFDLSFFALRFFIFEF